MVAQGRHGDVEYVEPVEEIAAKLAAGHRLLAYDWPGNARELRNTIERATILANAGLIGVEHLPPHFGEPGYATRFTPPPAYDGHAAAAHPAGDDDHSVRVEVGTTVDEAERQLIVKTLVSTHNNKTRAAEILGITTKTLQNKLKEYASTAALDSAASLNGASASVADTVAAE